MKVSRRRRRMSARAAAAAAAANGRETVIGADFLLSMVETHWSARNGDASKMESGLRAQQELQKIERQIANLESAAGQDDEETHREIHQLHERVEALRREVSAHLNA